MQWIAQGGVLVYGDAMSTDLYPTIDPAVVNVFKLVQQMADADANYLESEDCPYPEPVKSFFRKKNEAKRTAIAATGAEVDLEGEAVALYATLKEFGDDLGGEGIDTKEYMAWIKTVVQMQEKLLLIAERSRSVKWLKLFEAAVFGILEDLPADLRTQCIDKLKKVAG